MPNVYTAEYLQRFEIEERTFSDKGEALRFRNELKKQGFQTEWERFDYTDLARGIAYVVTGTRERR
jgi:hypothetical protein